MRQELALVLDHRDVAYLGRGKALAFQLGDQQITLRFAESEKRSPNGLGPGICNGCKRDLRVEKHSRTCSILHSLAARGRKRNKS
jgi:hypothetical protein